MSAVKQFYEAVKKDVTGDKEQWGYEHAFISYRIEESLGLLEKIKKETTGGEENLKRLEESLQRLHSFVGPYLPF